MNMNELSEWDSSIRDCIFTGSLATWNLSVRLWGLHKEYFALYFYQLSRDNLHRKVSPGKDVISHYQTIPRQTENQEVQLVHSFVFIRTQFIRTSG